MTGIDRRTLAKVLAAGAAAGSSGTFNARGRDAFAANAPSIKAGRFDIAEIAASFPQTAETLLVNRYLTDQPSASARVFRIYKPVPPHFHKECDEYLYVFSGRGTFWMGDPSTKAEFGPGQLLFFEKGTVHSVPELLEEPVVFLSVDTPRRDPKDITFVNPSDGTTEGFVKQHKPGGY